MASRSPWLPRVLLGVAALALGAGLVTLSVGEGGPDSPPNRGFAEVQQLYAGVEQEGAVLGSPDADVVVDVFNDVNCRSCGEWYVEELEPVIEAHARRGTAAFEFSHFSLGPQSTTLGALAATAAGEQGRQWQYLALLQRNLESAPGEANEEFLREVAEVVPELDQDRWDADRDSAGVREIVEADADEAVRLRLPPEAVVIVTGPGGEERLEGFPSRGEIERAIRRVSA